MRLALFLLALLWTARAAPHLSVTVVDPRTGRPLTGLTASRFAVSDEHGELTVDSATYSSGPVDILLLLDASVLGQMVSGQAAEMVALLGGGDRMAVAAFQSSADLLQEFTPDKAALSGALARVKFGGSPRLLDALYAALDSGFESAATRRRHVLLLLASGVDGSSAVPQQDVLRLARRGAVSIYPVYVIASQRSLLESLARHTGGAAFHLRPARVGTPTLEAIMAVMRGHYTVLLKSDREIGRDWKVEVKGVAGRASVSALPLD